MYSVIVWWKLDYREPEDCKVKFEEHEDIEKALDAMFVFVNAWEKEKAAGKTYPYAIYVEDEKGEEVRIERL